MFSQQSLIYVTDSEFAKMLGKKETRIFEKLCGYFTLEDLFTTDTVYICAMRCAYGFKNKNDTQVFLKKPWQNAEKICEKVLSGKFVPRYYPTKVIIERGKPRTIKPPTFECKVVQKVICDYLIRPLLEPKMTSTCYASVTGRGTSKMYEDICRELNRQIDVGNEFSVITFDYKGYFASIPVGRLMGKLERYIYDSRIIVLIHKFSPDEYGLSLGNELSQIPASWYPSDVDHYFKDRLRLPQFRYMDDSLIICPKGEENKCIRTYQGLSEKDGLLCPDEKVHIYPMQESFVFCKERFIWNKKKKGYDRLINPKSVSGEERKLHSFKRLEKEGKITKEAIKLQSDSVIGTIKKHPHTHKDTDRLKGIQKDVLGDFPGEASVQEKITVQDNKNNIQSTGKEAGMLPIRAVISDVEIRGCEKREGKNGDYILVWIEPPYSNGETFSLVDRDMERLDLYKKGTYGDIRIEIVDVIRGNSKYTDKEIIEFVPRHADAGEGQAV